MITIGDSYNRGIISVARCFLLIALSAGIVYGGNKEMVEKNIVELDKLNKEAVGKIPDLPSDGEVHLKANISTKDGKKEIEIIELQVVPAAPAKPADPGSTGKNDSYVQPSTKEDDILYQRENSLLPQNSNEDSK